jgi:hypothetical protein
MALDDKIEKLEMLNKKNKNSGTNQEYFNFPSLSFYFFYFLPKYNLISNNYYNYRKFDNSKKNNIKKIKYL